MPSLTFTDIVALHLGYVLSSLLIAAVFLGLMFLTAYVAALIDLAKERRARRRKESRNV
ncbi:membrane protein [Arthrobacter phage Cassia]|uniref:Membrane protein n=1 Tax=Arthrobacter phage Cassia TaxID=2927275 RepID=A0AAF0GGY6_9CAUD|nr:membrane protein [Arthrobacter phage Cassia]